MNTARILFVDDDEFILLCYKRLLGRHFSIETAPGPVEAMDAVKRERFAVVASDMHMPGMSGVELLQRVKEASPQTVGILVTGNPESDGIEESALQTSIFRIVAKPCPTADLIAFLEEALKRYQENTQAGIC